MLYLLLVTNIKNKVLMFINTYRENLQYKYFFSVGVLVLDTF